MAGVAVRDTIRRPRHGGRGAAPSGLGRSRNQGLPIFSGAAICGQVYLVQCMHCLGAPPEPNPTAFMGALPLFPFPPNRTGHHATAGPR